MKNSIIFLLCIFTFTSCYNEDDSCKYPDGETTPDGYTFKFLSRLDDKRGFSDFQMITSTVGYIIGSKESGSLLQENASLFKTEDGGSSWTGTPLTGVNRRYSCEFKNENIGYISYQVEDSISNFSKTTNGGLDWEEIETPNFLRPLYDLKIDASGNVFGIHRFDVDSLVTMDSMHLMKYSEQDAVWSIIYRGTWRINYQNSAILDIIDDKLYINERDRKVFVIDTNGNIEKTYNSVSAEHIKVIDVDNVYVSNGSSVEKTSTGGDRWDDWDAVHDGGGFLLDYSSEHGVLVFLNTVDKYCAYPLEELSSFAVGKSTSLTVDYSPPMTDKPFDTLKDVQKIDDATYLIRFLNEIYELKRL